MTFQHYHRALRVPAILSLFGMFVTAYLVYQHYKPAGGSFCEISDYVSCDVVNKSKYSEIFGVPVSILGFLAYTIFFLGTIGLLREWHFEKISRHFRPQRILAALTIFSGISVLFSLYLTYIELFILKAICILCITQQVLILFIFIIFLFLWLKNRKFAHSS